MVGSYDQRPLAPSVLAPRPGEAKVEQEEDLDHQAADEVDDRIDPFCASELVVGAKPLRPDASGGASLRRDTCTLLVNVRIALFSVDGRSHGLLRGSRAAPSRS